MAEELIMLAWETSVEALEMRRRFDEDELDEDDGFILDDEDDEDLEDDEALDDEDLDDEDLDEDEDFDFGEGEEDFG